MTNLNVIAHGVVGNMDEALILGIVTLFILTLITSWLQSRHLTSDEPQNIYAEEHNNEQEI